MSELTLVIGLPITFDQKPLGENAINNTTYKIFRWYSIVLDELSVYERPQLCLLLLQMVF